MLNNAAEGPLVFEVSINYSPLKVKLSVSILFVRNEAALKLFSPIGKRENVHAPNLGLGLDVGSRWGESMGSKCIQLLLLLVLRCNLVPFLLSNDYFGVSWLVSAFGIGPI